MNQGITLIGMPGTGKSTIGNLIAPLLNMKFIDTDELITSHEGRSLQKIIDDQGYLSFIKIEEREILKITPGDQVTATGGSAVHSDSAMTHLRKISTCIYLKTPLEILQKRIGDYQSRGIAKPAKYSLKKLYLEREPFYQSFAHATVDCSGLTKHEVVEAVIQAYTSKNTD